MAAIDALKSLRFDHTLHIDFDKFNTHVDSLESRGLRVLIAKQIDELTRMRVLESPDGDDDNSESLEGRRQFYDKFFCFWRQAVERLHGELTFTFEDLWLVRSLAPVLFGKLCPERNALRAEAYSKHPTHASVSPDISTYPVAKRIQWQPETGSATLYLERDHKCQLLQTFATECSGLTIPKLALMHMSSYHIIGIRKFEDFRLH